MSEYEELLRKRLLLQESILEAMEAYRTVSLKVHTQTTRIKELAGDTPPYELAQMRSKGEQIPLNLRPAFSLMQTLAPDKAYQESIIQRLDEILEEGQLEKFDRSIGFKENEILYGGILSAEQQEEIKRALNQDVVNVGTVGGIERETTEDKIWKDFEAPSAWE